MKKNPGNIIGAACLVSVAYWRRGTSVCQYIGAPSHPAPLLMAHQTKKMHKNVRILSRQGGGIIRCANNICTLIGPKGVGGGGVGFILACLLEDRTNKFKKRGGPSSSVRLAYFHTNRLLIELYQQETEIRCRKDDGFIKK
jgi:hypothetical protein